YEQAEQPTYFSGKLRQAFSVEDLLNGIEKPEIRQPSPPCSIFVLYSRKDVGYKEQLLEHLMPLVRLNRITLWQDDCIDPGEEWRPEMFNHLEVANIVLCLISSSFVTSDFCYREELSTALNAHREGRKIVIPIQIRECNWDQLEIAQIQGLPGYWMTDLKDDASWTKISKGIEAAIERVKRPAK
ncbi:MAG: toll/interleukin-1 receptor domain-containing protein, partial [Bacteroidota bacterium]